MNNIKGKYAKGVIMTTSKFSQPAKDFVRQIKDKRIILVAAQIVSVAALIHWWKIRTKEFFLFHEGKESHHLYDQQSDDPVDHKATHQKQHQRSLHRIGVHRQNKTNK